MKKLYFYGVRRSGTHPIIKWVWSNFSGEKEYSPYKIDPIKSYKHMPSFSDKECKVIFLNNFDHLYENETLEFLNHNNPEISKLIILYENYPYKLKNENYLIIRDFINLLCSRIQQVIKSHPNPLSQVGTGLFYKEHIDIWLQHASFIQDKNTIIYNKWVVDKEYRNNISKELFYVENLDYLDYSQPFGGGSSFIGRNKEVELQNYLNRYKLIRIPKFAKNIILNNSDLLEINKKHFNIDIEQILWEE